MEFVVNAGEVVLMSDNACYLVLSTIEHNNEGYLMMSKVAEDIIFPIEEDERRNIVYAKEIVEGENFSLEFVEDSDLIKQLKKSQINKLQNENS